jgi:hypothetical protein
MSLILKRIVIYPNASLSNNLIKNNKYAFNSDQAVLIFYQQINFLFSFAALIPKTFVIKPWAKNQNIWFGTRVRPPGTRIEMKFFFFNLIIRPWVLIRIFSKNGIFQFDRYTRVHKTKYSFFSKKNNNFRVLQYFIKVFLNLKACILIFRLNLWRHLTINNHIWPSLTTVIFMKMQLCCEIL